MHGLEAKYDNKIQFTYLDIDDPANESFKQKLGYRVQPHLFLLDGEGNILAQWVGAITAEDLETAFQSALQE